MLIVETGAGLTNANSFASVAEADTYHEDRNNTSWAEADNADKEAALIKATQYLVLTYYGMWSGERVNRLQSLPWPRFDAFDADGFDYPSTIVPEPLKNATAELALRVIDGDENLVVDVDTSGEITAESVKVGPIAVSEKYASVKGQQKRYTVVEQWVRPLLGQSSSQGTVERG